MKGKYVLKSVMALLALCGILSISRLSVEAAEIGEDVAVSDNEVKEQIIEESVDLESAAPVLRDITVEGRAINDSYSSNYVYIFDLMVDNFVKRHWEGDHICGDDYTIYLESLESGYIYEVKGDTFRDIDISKNLILNVPKGQYRILSITLSVDHGNDHKFYYYFPEVPFETLATVKDTSRDVVYCILPDNIKNMVFNIDGEGGVSVSNSGSAQEYPYTKAPGGPLISQFNGFRLEMVRGLDGRVGATCVTDYPANYDSQYIYRGRRSDSDSGRYFGGIYAIFENEVAPPSLEASSVWCYSITAPVKDPKKRGDYSTPPINPSTDGWYLDYVIGSNPFYLSEICVIDAVNPTILYHFCTEMPSGIANGEEVHTLSRSGEGPLDTDIYYQLPESMKGIGFSILANGEMQINDVTTQQTKNFVSRLYTVALGRDAEEAGLNDWTNRLLAKQENAAQVARGFFFSDEFKNRNYSDEEFVELLYQTMFGRAGDGGGTQYWLSCLENGVSREYVYHGFAESQEFSELCSNYGLDRGSVTLSQYRDRNADATGFIARLYTKMLGRKFDEDGLEYWCKAYLTGEKSIEVIASDGFLHSEELKNMNLSNEEFVTRMYETFLNREPEEAGLNDWVGRLERGEETRDSLVYGFTNSREFGGLKAEYHLP